MTTTEETSFQLNLRRTRIETFRYFSISTDNEDTDGKQTLALVNQGFLSKVSTFYVPLARNHNVILLADWNVSCLKWRENRDANKRYKRH